MYLPSNNDITKALSLCTHVEVCMCIYMHTIRAEPGPCACKAHTPPLKYAHAHIADVTMQFNFFMQINEVKENAE